MTQNPENKAKSGLLLVNASDWDKSRPNAFLTRILTPKEQKEEATHALVKPAYLCGCFERSKRKESDGYTFWAYAMTTTATLNALFPSQPTCC